MSDVAIDLLIVGALYLAAGIAIAVLWLAGGAERILPETATISLGARILMLPGAVVMWPVVLVRLLQSRSTS